jgi:hypothetical protein
MDFGFGASNWNPISGSFSDFSGASGIEYNPPGGGGGFGGGFFGPGGGPFGNPLTLGLAGANVAASMNAANQAREAALGTAAGQIQALNRARQDQIDFNLANNAAERAAQFGYGPDLNLAREKDAFRTQLQAKKELDLFNLDLKNSPAAREAARFANKLAIENALATRLGQTAAMFGSSAPVNISTLTV